MKKIVKRSSAILLTVLILCSLITVATPIHAVTLDPAANPYGSVKASQNLLPENVLSNRTEASKVFKQRDKVNSKHVVGEISDKVTFAQEDGEDVMYIPYESSNTWVYTAAQAEYENYTVSFDICPIAKPNSTEMAATGILLGTSPTMDFPWHNMQLNYSSTGVWVYAILHQGSAYGYTNAYTTPFLPGQANNTTPQWYNVRIESTPEGTLFYVNDVLLPQAALDDLPDSEEITYIGFYPAGSSNGFKVRNFELYEGVDLDLSLTPENLFYSSTTASTYFKNISTDAADYTVENGEYVMRAPIVSNSADWVYTSKLPSGSYTVDFEICPTYNADGTTLGSTGILLGEGTDASPYRYPWHNMQLQYTDGGLKLFAVNHKGNAYGYTDSYTVLPGTGYTTPKWYRIRIEATPDGTKMYVNGALLPEAALAKLPNADQIRYIGLYPAGGTNGFKVKNFNIYEGVPESDNLLPDDLFQSYETAQAWLRNASTNAAHYTKDNGSAVMRMPVVSNGNAWISTSRTIPYESYTVSVDFAPQMFTPSSGSDRLGGAGFLVGTSASGGFPFHNLRFNFDATKGTVSFFGYAQDSNGYLYMDSGYTVIRENIDFASKKWFNLTAEVTKDSVKVYLDGEQFLVEKINRLPNSTEIAYFGFMAEGGSNGFDVKNFKITEGVEAEIKAAVPELKDAITLHMQANVDTDSTEPVRMKFSFKGEDIWKEGVQSGNQYTFSLPDILPQDMGETISAELYIGDTLMDTVEAYSMKQYCLNQLNNTDDAALKALLVALLNYGAEAQTYFGSTDTLVNDGLDQSILSDYLASKNYDVSNPEGSVATPVSGENTGDYVWKAATLGLYDMVNVRVKFKAPSVEDLKVVVNGTDVYTEFVEIGGGLYHVYIPVYAGDFADTMTITFQNSTGNVGATLNYNVNTYVKYAMDNGAASVKPLVESIYYYGVLAAEMK